MSSRVFSLKREVMRIPMIQMRLLSVVVVYGLLVGCQCGSGGERHQAGPAFEISVDNTITAEMGGLPVKQPRRTTRFLVSVHTGANSGCVLKVGNVRVSSEKEFPADKMEVWQAAAQDVSGTSTGCNTWSLPVPAGASVEHQTLLADMSSALRHLAPPNTKTSTFEVDGVRVTERVTSKVSGGEVLKADVAGKVEANTQTFRHPGSAVEVQLEDLSGDSLRTVMWRKPARWVQSVEGSSSITKKIIYPTAAAPVSGTTITHRSFKVVAAP